jgi:hypothetical protein
MQEGRQAVWVLRPFYLQDRCILPLPNDFKSRQWDQRLSMVKMGQIAHRDPAFRHQASAADKTQLLRTSRNQADKSSSNVTALHRV